MNTNLAEKFSIRIFLFFTALIVFVRALPILIYPTFHMDESYYIGASRAIQSGDWLMTSYEFDKLFLQPFLLIPGILFAGLSTIGYRLSGLVFTGASLYFYFRLFLLLWKKIAGCVQPQSRLQRIAPPFMASLMSLFFLLQPVVLAHTVSAMTEPFLLCFLLAAANYTLDDHHRQKRWPAWALSALVKLSCVMWLPFIVGVDLFIYRENVREDVRNFWNTTKWLWITALFFMAFNKKKFAALSWFSHLGKSEEANRVSLMARLEFWTTHLNSNLNVFGFQFSAIIWSIILVSITLSAMKLIAKKVALSTPEKLTLILTGSTALHFIGLSLSSAPLFDRYLVIFYPQFFLSAFFASYHLCGFAGRASQFARTLCTVLILPALTVSALAAPLIYLQPNPQSGRTLEAMRDLISQDAVLFTKHPWEPRPYENLKWEHYGCEDLMCLWMNRATPVFTRAILLTEADQTGFALFRSPILVDRVKNQACYTVKSSRMRVSLKQDLLKSFRDQSRMRSERTQIEIKIKPSVPSDFAWEKAGDLIAFGKQNLLNGPSVEMSLNDGKVSAQLNGRVLLVPTTGLSPKESGLSLGLYIEDAQILTPFRAEITDLLPLAWNARVLPLTKLDLQNVDQNSIYELISYDRNSNEISMQVSSVAGDNACITKTQE